MELLEQRQQVGQVQPAVQRCHVRHRERPARRKLQKPGVEVDDVEQRRHAGHAVDQDQVIGEPVAARRVQAHGLRSDRHERRSCLRIAARKQGDFMSEGYQRIGEVCHDTFSAAVRFRRHAFDQRGNLCNTHPSTHSGCMGCGAW